LSSFGCVEIYIGNISSLVGIEIKVYCVVYSEAVEIPCHKFSTSDFFVVVIFLHAIWIPGILALCFPVYIDITDGDCGTVLRHLLSSKEPSCFKFPELDDTA